MAVDERGHSHLRLETSDDPSFRKAHKAVRKVNRDAYTFRPDVLLTVGVDIANGRVVIKEDQKVNGGGVQQRDHFHTMHHQIELAVRAYCLKERTRLGIYKRECNHPLFRRKKRLVCVGEDKGVSIRKMVLFCTKCGKKMEET